MSRNLRLQVLLDAVDRVTGPLRNIQNQSRGLSGALRSNRDELRGLERQQSQIKSFQDMTRQAQDSRKALNDKRGELREIERQLATTTGPTRRLTQQQARAQREVEKLSRSYTEQRDRARQLSRELPEKAQGIRNLGHQQAELTRQIEQANRRIERQQNALERLSRADVSGRFRNMTREVGRFGRRLAMVGTGAAAGVFGLAASTAKAGDEIAKTADLMGIGTRELQELHYAAQRAGMETGVLDNTMQRFVRRAGRAAQGTGAAAKTYDELGLSARALADMDPGRALEVVADRLNEVEGQTDRVAYASAIFGNEGEAMLNMIRGGSEALRELRHQAHITGNVLSEESVRDAEAFQDAMGDARLTMLGMRHTIGAALMPAVTELMQKLAGWMQENRARVQAFAKTFGQRMKEALPAILDAARAVANMGGTIARATAWVANLVGGFGNLAAIVTVLFGLKAIASVVMFGAAIFKAGAAILSFFGGLTAVIGVVKAFSAMLLATPLGWIIMLVAGLAAGVYMLYRNWDKVTEFFSGIWQRIREAFDGGITGVSDLILDWSPLGLFYQAFRKLFSWFDVELPESFSQFGRDMIGGLIGGLTAVIGKVANVFSSMWRRIREAFDGGITGVSDLILDWSPLGLFYQAFRKLFSWFDVELPESFSQFGRDMIGGLIGGITGRLGDLKDSVTDAGSKVTGWFAERLGIRSPSRVFAAHGADIMGGLEQGMEREGRGVLQHVQRITRGIARAGAGGALGMGIATASAGAPIDNRPPMAMGGGGGGVVVNGGIHVHVEGSGSGENIEQRIQQAVRQALEDVAVEQAARQRSSLYDLD